MGDGLGRNAALPRMPGRTDSLYRCRIFATRASEDPHYIVQGFAECLGDIRGQAVEDADPKFIL